MLPNGLRVNYNRGNPVINAGPALNLGGRVNPEPYHAQASGLTNSLYRANGVSSGPFSNQFPPFPSQTEDYTFGGAPSNPTIAVDVPAIDTTHASPHAALGFSRPGDDDAALRFGLALSPQAVGLSVLDAPLPASFDSNGISHYARMGPMGSSVPAKFSMETPPGSVPARSSEALRNLHTSAFGDESTRERFNAASPSTEEYFGKRPMHSTRLAIKPVKSMSSSLPKAVDQDWEAAFTFEEDYLPSTLTELMTPQEKARRGSKAADDYNSGQSISGTPNNETIKFGSPGNASPSRWSAYFSQRVEQEERERDREREKLGSRGSAFGHVGSPLRASLHPGAIPPRPLQRAHTSGEATLSVASPPRQSSMSIISQQLQRTRLSRAESNPLDSGLGLVLGAGTVTRNGLIGASREKAAATLMVDRTMSSSSFGTGGSGRFTTPIEEHEGEGDAGVFSMEEDEERRNGLNSTTGSIRDKEKQKIEDKRSSAGSLSASGSNSASAVSSWSGAGATAFSRSPAHGSIGDGRMGGKTDA